MNTEKTKTIITIIFAIIVLICVIIYEVVFNKKAVDEQNEVNIVKDNSRFYTVSSCVGRYLNYLSSKDVDNLILIVDDNYKKSNKINKENILKYLPNISEKKDFSAKKMYEEVINDNYYRYYVYGKINNSSLIVDDNYEGEDFYTIVIMNTNSHTYSVVPYDGKMFKEEKDNE